MTGVGLGNDDIPGDRRLGSAGVSLGGDLRSANGAGVGLGLLLLAEIPPLGGDERGGVRVEQDLLAGGGGQGV